MLLLHFKILFLQQKYGYMAASILNYFLDTDNLE